jgi:hypothetical protein
MVAFQKATRTKKKLRAALLGPAGAGKTRTALEIAKGLGDKIALIDTEHGSASMYAHIVDFDALELASFSPDRYIEAIGAAEEAGYDVLVIDSLSHAWSGKGGILEFVDRSKKNGNSFNAWGDATPLQNKLVERLLTCRMHLIVTMRTKMEFVQEKDERTGKTIVRKIGLQPVQRDGVEYEFDVICDIDQSHTMTVAKTRIDSLDGEIIEKAGEPFGRRLRSWLDGGAPVKLAPVAAPTKVEREPTEDRTAKAIAWARKHLETLTALAGSTPAGQGEDGTDAVAGALKVAREKADATVKRLAEVDARLSVAVLALGDEVECKAVGLARSFSDDETAACEWFRGQ